ncbi:MMPL family transporter [Nocardioides nematodiphilus]|uniref:MMPL family transporter n=1 Tax=Nocardioides nematodiphilus TaxID=2849669 RepID=UPI001CD93FB3|nr:MMPL family transporter [Nocardioides nematodiphilus]MCA1983466.1 MMPL family transporter [Nocardioides nematodiphilus]
MHRQIAGALTGRVTKWLVLVAWLIVIAGAAPFAQKLGDVQNNEASSWLPATAESTKALDKLAPFTNPDDIPTVVLYHRTGGLTPADFQAIAAQAPQIGALDGVVTPSDGRPAVTFPKDAASGRQLGLVSADGAVATTVVTFNLGSAGWDKMPPIADHLREIATISGVDVHLAGPGGQVADAADAFAGIDGTLLFAALGVVIVILLFTYRSPILWVLPIVSAVFALFTAEAVIYFLAKYADLTVNGQSQAILSVLVIGAGTDYALLLVARYREELRRHQDRHEAMAVALHRASPAVIASASTVAIGMLCLLLAQLNSTKGLGPVMAVGVIVTLVVMLTLLPALLVITGRWVFWPRRPSYGSDEPTTHGLWAKVGNRISVRPRIVWVTTSIVLLAACLGMLTLRTGNLPSEDQYTKTYDSVVGQRILVAHGLADTSTPIQVVTTPERVDDVVAALGKVPGLGAVNTSIPPVAGVKYVSVTQALDPASQKAADQVVAVREAVRDVPDTLVGGSAAIYLDTAHAAHRDNKVIIPVVLLVVMLILMLLLRALVAPVILILTVILSFGAALGLSALIFTHLYGFDMADSGFPLFVFVFLVALGIDYNIFLMTRVREETQRVGTRAGSLIALSSTGGVITSAGLVLAATFAVLGSIPLVFLAEIGTAIALGVILDTMVVRGVLVTALNLDLGSRIWWPSKLDRAPAAEPETTPALTDS